MIMLDTVLIGSIGALVIAKLAITAVVVYWSVRGVLDQGKQHSFILKPVTVSRRHSGKFCQ